MGTIVAVLSGFALATAAPRVHRICRGAAGWVLALLPLGLFAFFAWQLAALPARGGIPVQYPWVPGLGISFSFYVDGLGLLFALLISGIGALVLVYAGGYLTGHPQLGRLYAFLLMFMASMLGLVLADDVVTLFLFWELTGLSSYFLIGFDHERVAARAAALQALLVTGGGGLALLAGLLLLGLVGGSFAISALRDQAEAVQTHGLYLPILALILVAAFTKSAQFPFHFWLPAAMEAPTPVSAYLHSATMVKAGVYLLARLHPVLGGTDAWLWSVSSVGAVTMLVGAYLALQERDLKRILAYTTVGALGILVLMLGLGTGPAVAAALAFLLGHALYKGALFLVAGAVDHETGTRDVDRLGGLGRLMPVTASAAALAALSMAGLPPLLGFLAKEMVYEATLQAPAAFLLTAVVLLASLGFVAVAGVVGFRPFAGQRPDTPRHPHEPPPALWLGPVLLAGAGVVLGLVPQWAGRPVLSPAVAAVVRPQEHAPVAFTLWHGWTVALALSAVNVIGGAGVYLLRGRLRQLLDRANVVARWGPARWYDLALGGVNGLARVQTQFLQSGYLRHYLFIILVTGVALAGFPLLAWGLWPGAGPWSEVRFYEVGLAGLISLATLMTPWVRSRLAAIATLGVVGYGVALLFVLFGAPDLAMTQFLVETLTVILFVLVFYHSPARGPLAGRPTRIRDAVVAVAVGGLMTVLVLLAGSAQEERQRLPGASPSVSQYYAEHSLPQAHGRNVVNVILVDFRGLDTLGEITVLAVAGIGVYALLKLRLGDGGGK